jgi:sarcosine oxidase
VTAVRDLGAGGLEVETTGGVLHCEGLVVCADAWTNDVLAGLDVQVPFEVTLEQVTYFRPERPDDFAPGRLPLWIWMDDPSYYGFPCFGEATVKAAQDCGGPVVDPDHRTSDRGPRPGGPARPTPALPASRQRCPGALVALPVHADP